MSLVHLPQAKSKPIKASHRGKWRAGVLIAIHLAFAIRIAHYHATGEGVTPVEPSEAMQTLELGMVNAGFIFFLLAILSTMLFGRYFCGWACHVVALQDLCGAALKKLGWQPKPFRSRTLVFIPLFAALYMFVWPQVLRLMEGRGLPPITYHFTTDDFWATFPNPWITALTFLVCGFLAVLMLGNKGFCTYGCPYGAAFYHADRVSRFRIRVTDACNGCGHCTAVCSSNVRVHDEVKLHQMVVDPACMKCMDCVSTCPNDALYVGYGKGVGKLQPKRAYDYSWPEEIGLVLAFLIAFYAVRGLYETIPFLLALGWAGIFAFLTLSLVRLFRDPQLRLQRLQLKRQGKWLPSGFAFAVAMLAMWGLTGHSVVVQFNAHEAQAHLDQAQRIFEGRTPAPRSEAERLARQAYAEFNQAKNLGLVPVPAWEARQGAIKNFLGEEREAEQHFLAALKMDPDILAALTPLYDMYIRQERWSEAEQLARQWVARFPRRAVPAQALGVALYRQGKTEEAEPLLRRGVASPEVSAHGRAALAGIAFQKGGVADGERLLRAAVAQAPTERLFRLELAQVLVNRGEYDESMAILDALVQTLPPYMPGIRLRANESLKQEDFERALDSVERLRLSGEATEEDARLWAEVVVRSGQADVARQRMEAEGLDPKFRSAFELRNQQR